MGKRACSLLRPRRLIAKLLCRPNSVPGVRADLVVRATAQEVPVDLAVAIHLLADQAVPEAPEAPASPVAADLVLRPSP